MLVNINTLSTVSDYTFRSQYKNTSFPAPLTDAILAPFGYAVLIETPPPAIADTWTERAVEGTPEHRDGQWHQTWTLEPVVHTPEEEEEHFAQVKADKLQEILSGSNAAAMAVKSRYSTLEVDSWPVQQAQAEAVLSGKALPYDALLVTLATANGVSTTEFATRVMQNVANAEAVTKAVVAQQQAYELALKSCTTVEEVQAITVSYTLPDVAA